MKTKIDGPLSRLFNRFGELRYPVIHYGERLIALAADKGEAVHRFGGLPSQMLPLPMQRLVLTILLNRLPLEIRSSVLPEEVPLIFDFDINGLSMFYRVSKTGVCLDPDVISAELSEGVHENADDGERIELTEEEREWSNAYVLPQPAPPHEDFPSVFPELNLGDWLHSDLSFEEFAEHFTSQGLETHNVIRVIVPPFKGFAPSRSSKFTMWGKEGDDEGCLCIFEIDPITGVIDSFNQCL